MNSSNLNVYTNQYSTACGYRFKEGSEYLIFGRKGSKRAANDGFEVEGEPMISDCSPTVEINHATEQDKDKLETIFKYLESKIY